MAEGLKIVNEIYEQTLERIREPEAVGKEIDSGLVFLAIVQAMVVLEEDPSLSGRLIDYLGDA